MDDICWVGADGALHSGSAGELMHAFLAGTLPGEHPVWHEGWSEWVLLADVIAERRLEPAPPAKPGELPATTLRFGGGDPEMDQQRPAVAALPEDRWFLAWVEGDRASGRRIRGRILTANLAPIGAPVELASTPSYVGSLAVHAEGPELVVLFTERSRRQSDVLSAVRATCR